MTPEAQVVGVGDAEQSLLTQTAAEQGYVTTQEPLDAHAAASGGSWTVSNAFGLFNVVVGLMLVAAFLLFFGGFTGYLTRLGLEGRTQGLVYMYRGVSVLFVLIILLALVNFLQFHTEVVIAIVGILIVAFGAWVVVKTWGASGAEDEEH